MAITRASIRQKRGQEIVAQGVCHPRLETANEDREEEESDGKGHQTHEVHENEAQRSGSRRESTGTPAGCL